MTAHHQCARSRRRSTAFGVSVEVAPEVTRRVPEGVKCLLWGRATGRCEHEGCNRPLWRTIATNEPRNIAEQAHIRAFSRGGPRADPIMDATLINDVSNLILLCHDHHVAIDRSDGPTRYTVALLEQMKASHEHRIEVVTGISPRLSTHVLTYGTYVGEHQALPTFAVSREALFPRRFPATESAIQLGTPVGPRRDRDTEFWGTELAQLDFQFDRQVRQPIERGEINHVSVFALAPQPLLIRLGVLLGDIIDADVYQLLREPKGWVWSSDHGTPPFHVDRPAQPVGAPALVLSISGTIMPDRIIRACGSDTAIWSVTVPTPHNDVVRSPDMLKAFRECLRQLLNEIKTAHGHAVPLRIFPAMPVSLAVELGRVRMPKADTRWEVFDEHQAHGGFSHALTISSENR